MSGPCMTIPEKLRDYWRKVHEDHEQQARNPGLCADCRPRATAGRQSGPQNGAGSPHASLHLAERQGRGNETLILSSHGEWSDAHPTGGRTRPPNFQTQDRGDSKSIPQNIAAPSIRDSARSLWPARCTNKVRVPLLWPSSPIQRTWLARSTISCSSALPSGGARIETDLPWP